jgi:hypothetical protein
MMSFLLGWWAGCQPPASRHVEPTAEEKKLDLARAVVNSRAAHARDHVGADGWFSRKSIAESPNWKRNLNDPWGRPYDIQFDRDGDTESLVVWSDGPDGVPGTGDDIHSDRHTLYHSKTLANIAKTREQMNAQLAGDDWGDSTVYGYEPRPQGVVRRVTPKERP